MAVQFVRVESDDQIDQLAQMASAIWKEYWPDIIGSEQTDYMVDKFQSASAIKDQMTEQGYEYYVMSDGDTKVGYLGLQPQPDDERLFLSKLYLYKDARGQGYSSEAFAYLESVCRDRDLDAIWLTVNKNNKKAIDVYKVKGFETVRSQTMPIGEGFVMDDFVMEKIVGD